MIDLNLCLDDNRKRQQNCQTNEPNELVSASKRPHEPASSELELELERNTNRRIKFTSNAPIPVDVLDCQADEQFHSIPQQSQLSSPNQAVQIRQVNSVLNRTGDLDETFSELAHKSLEAKSVASNRTTMTNKQDIDDYWVRQPSDRRFGTLTLAASRLAERQFAAKMAAEQERRIGIGIGEISSSGGAETEVDSLAGERFLLPSPLSATSERDRGAGRKTITSSNHVHSCTLPRCFNQQLQLQQQQQQQISNNSEFYDLSLTSLKSRQLNLQVQEQPHKLQHQQSSNKLQSSSKCANFNTCWQASRDGLGEKNGNFEIGPTNYERQQWQQQQLVATSNQADQIAPTPAPTSPPPPLPPKVPPRTTSQQRLRQHSPSQLRQLHQRSLSGGQVNRPAPPAPPVEHYYSQEGLQVINSEQTREGLASQVSRFENTDQLNACSQLNCNNNNKNGFLNLPSSNHYDKQMLLTHLQDIADSVPIPNHHQQQLSFFEGRTSSSLLTNLQNSFAIGQRNSPTRNTLPLMTPQQACDQVNSVPQQQKQRFIHGEQARQLEHSPEIQQTVSSPFYPMINCSSANNNTNHNDDHLLTENACLGSHKRKHHLPHIEAQFTIIPPKLSHKHKTKGEQSIGAGDGHQMELEGENISSESREQEALEKGQLFVRSLDEGTTTTNTNADTDADANTITTDSASKNLPPLPDRQILIDKKLSIPTNLKPSSNELRSKLANGLPQAGQRSEQRKLKQSLRNQPLSQVETICPKEKIETYLRHYVMNNHLTQQQQLQQQQLQLQQQQQQFNIENQETPPLSNSPVEVEKLDEFTFQPYHNLPWLKYTINLSLQKYV